MPNPKRAVKPRKSAEIVADDLREEIVSGALSVGDLFPVERELIERYGVGRTTLREALRILETEGLIEVLRGAQGGARVVGPSLDLASHAVRMVLRSQSTELIDVQTARTIIEPPAARMFVENATPEGIAALELALEEERECAGTPEFPFAAMRFHEKVVEHSGNHTLSAFLMVIHDIHEGVATALAEGGVGAEGRSRTIETHARLLECARTGAADEAEKLWRDYWIWVTPLTLRDGSRVLGAPERRR